MQQPTVRQLWIVANVLYREQGVSVADGWSEWRRLHADSVCRIKESLEIANITAAQFLAGIKDLGLLKWADRHLDLALLEECESVELLRGRALAYGFREVKQ